MFRFFQANVLFRSAATAAGLVFLRIGSKQSTTLKLFPANSIHTHRATLFRHPSIRSERERETDARVDFRSTESPAPSAYFGFGVRGPRLRTPDRTQEKCNQKCFFCKTGESDRRPSTDGDRTDEVWRIRRHGDQEVLENDLILEHILGFFWGWNFPWEIVVFFCCYPVQLAKIFLLRWGRQRLWTEAELLGLSFQSAKANHLSSVWNDFFYIT